MIVLKDQDLTTVWEEFHALHALQPNCFQRNWGRRRQRFSWVNAIDYAFDQRGRGRRHLSLHVVVCEETWEVVDNNGDTLDQDRTPRLALQPATPPRQSPRTLQPRCTLPLGHRGQFPGGETSGLPLRARLCPELECHEGLPLPDAPGPPVQRPGSLRPPPARPVSSAGRAWRPRLHPLLLRRALARPGADAPAAGTSRSSFSSNNPGNAKVQHAPALARGAPCPATSPHRGGAPKGHPSPSEPPAATAG